MAAQPVSSWRAAVRGDPGMADQSRPMRQRVGARNVAWRQVLSQVGPRFQRGCETLSDGSDVKEHRFASLPDGEPAEILSVHARGTEQLGRRTEVVQFVWISSKAQGDTDFLVAYRWVVGWQRRIELTLIMLRPTLHGNLEKPLRQAVASAAHARQSNCEAGNMSGVAQLLGEGRTVRLFLQFHSRQCITAPAS